LRTAAEPSPLPREQVMSWRLTQGGAHAGQLANVIQAIWLWHEHRYSLKVKGSGKRRHMYSKPKVHRLRAVRSFWQTWVPSRTTRRHLRIKRTHRAVATWAPMCVCNPPLTSVASRTDLPAYGPGPNSGRGRQGGRRAK